MNGKPILVPDVVQSIAVNPGKCPFFNALGFGG